MEADEGAEGVAANGLSGFAKIWPLLQLQCQLCYLSLKDIPRFDGAGLWRFRKGRFSRHGTLEETVEAVVGASLCGYTVAELETLLGVRVHNPISVLCRKKRLSRYYEGRHCVYVSAGEQGGAEQKKRRQGRRTAAQVQAGDPGALCRQLPKGSKRWS